MLIPLVGISEKKALPSFETSGFQGQGCKAATEAFERAVGTVTHEQNTAEFYETEERQEFLNHGD